MSDLDRRTVLTGAAAMAAAAMLPAVAAAAATPAADFSDSGIERLRAWIDGIFRALRAEGIAVVKLPKGGALVFWLQDDNDLTSMQMAELGEDVFS